MNVARLRSVRASGGNRGSARPSSSITISAPSVGTSLEDATFVLHMIAKQIPHRYPNIKFIVPHLGGPVPMLLNRLDKQGQNQSWPPQPRRGAEASPPRNSITTRCATARRPRSLCALEAFGADHLVTGSDYPVLQDYEAYKETFAYIGRLGLPPADLDKILNHNAQALWLRILSRSAGGRPAVRYRRRSRCRLRNPATPDSRCRSPACPRRTPRSAQLNAAFEP